MTRIDYGVFPVTLEQMAWATTVAIVLLFATYTLIGWQKVIECYRMWLDSDYWIPYNKVEFLSWITKAIIIVPGLIFKVEIWWLYLFALVTSIALIWVSQQKLLPTLVGFNSLWVWLSCMVLAQSWMS